jgi:negative regulator of sigma E activity
LGSQFSNRVQQALDKENVTEVRPSYAARWLKPVAGVAIAASVALMAIVTVGPGQNSVEGTAVDNLAGSPFESFVSPNTSLGAVPVSQQASTAGLANDREKMNSYLLRHYQVAGSTGGKGFVTLVPIVVTRTTVKNDEDEQAQADREELKNGIDSARQ